MQFVFNSHFGLAKKNRCFIHVEVSMTLTVIDAKHHSCYVGKIIFCLFYVLNVWYSWGRCFHARTVHKAVKSTKQWKQLYDLLSCLPHFFIHPTHIMFGQNQRMPSAHIMSGQLLNLLVDMKCCKHSYQEYDDVLLDQIHPTVCQCCFSITYNLTSLQYGNPPIPIHFFHVVHQLLIIVILFT